MTDDELTNAALPISTQYFLSNIIRVLIDDGKISRDQLQRAIRAAKAELESSLTVERIRASLLLEPSVGDI